LISIHQYVIKIQKSIC